MAALALGGVLLQSPEELLRRSDVGGFPPSSFRARLVLKTQPQNASHEIEVWRSGESKTLIRLLDPKERGKYLLRLEGQLWLLSPSAKKPVHLSPSYRLYGGATLDEVLGLRLSRDYQIESVSREKDTGGVRLSPLSSARCRRECSSRMCITSSARPRSGRSARPTGSEADGRRPPLSFSSGTRAGWSMRGASS